MVNPAPGAGERLLPLSFAQQRFWFLDQLEPNSPLYNIPVALHLTGGLDAGALHHSIDTLVARHESLRTTFPSEDGTPRQVVSPPESVPLPVVSLAELSASEKDDAVLRLVSGEAFRPFDLAGGPVIRARLWRLGAEEHVLLLVVHHIVSDGWSMGVLLRELRECYQAYRLGDTPQLPDLPTQYADYVLWQREQLTGDRLERQLDYWRSQLAGMPPVLELPADRPRPAASSYRGARLGRQLPDGLGEEIDALASWAQVTPFMVLLAVFQTLLARYTGRQDIVVGVPIAGRTNVKFEEVVGLFVNTLALRTDLSGDPTFRELLGRAREVAVGAYAHQDVPFERLVEALQPERSRQHAPLVQVLLALQNAPASRVELSGLEVRRLPLTGRTAKFDLSLVLRPERDSLHADVEYSTDLFDAPTIERLLDHYVILLRAVVADPGLRLSAIPLLPESERRRILVEWNAGESADPAGPCVHDLIAGQAARTPDAVALVFRSETLTYNDLERRANRLAHRLRGFGVGPEMRVGLAVTRSPELVIGVLAILKAGGVYLPLDPAYPPDRLRFMTRDAGAALVVTDEWLDGERAAIARERETSPALRISPDQLAYVIYTSGSTGEPRGVAVSHAALARHCGSVARCYGLTSSDRVLQFSAASWDASVEQMLATLVTGAAMVLRGAELWTAAEFRREILGSGVTTANLPTAYVDQLVREWAQSPELAPAGGRFRQVVVGGEALGPETVRLWRQSPLGAARVLNAYGPTEATVTATAFEVPPDFDFPGTAVPIGRPLENRATYVLDRHMHPVPVGVPGELYLGGASLARGYLGRPGATAERFVPDPFGAGRGARLYRTGDRVRYLASGDLEFLGRVDHQIKLRGYRIEPGEIEARLEQHAAVRQCVVMLREDAPGDRRLAAYLVPADPAAAPPSAASLREHLGASQPGYMLPSAFVWLPVLPLTPQGKVNRAALPAPGRAEQGSHAVAPEPLTPTEKQLAGIWCEVLSRPGVAADDNFFTLGGHSLLATQVMSRIRRIFGIALPLTTIFEAPTLSALAARVEAERGATGIGTEIPIRRRSRDAYRDTRPRSAGGSS